MRALAYGREVGREGEREGEMRYVPGGRQTKKAGAKFLWATKFLLLLLLAWYAGRFLAEEKFTSGPVTPRRFPMIFIIANAKRDVFRPLLERELNQNQSETIRLFFFFCSWKQK